MGGWIKIYRDIKEHWIWKSDRRLKWWIDILLTVNHSDSKVLIGGNLIECKRGQSVMSLETWAKRWGVTKKTVSDFFELLQKDSMLVHESLKITTRITIYNYDKYQYEVNGQETDGKQIVNGQETGATPKQEGIKNDKEEREYIHPEFSEIFYRWLKYKKDKKQSYKSEDSIKMAYNKLIKLSESNPKIAVLIVEQSLANNWDGLFPLKEGTKTEETPKLSIKTGAFIR